MDGLKKLLSWFIGISVVVGGSSWFLVRGLYISDVAGTFLFLGVMLVFSLGYTARVVDESEAWQHPPTDQELDDVVARSRRAEGYVDYTEASR